MTQDIIPELIECLYRPNIVDLPGGRFVVYAGYASNGGWYRVNSEFTMEDALSRWKPLESKKAKEEKKPADDWTWEVANSKKNGYYTVAFDKRGWTCTCTGYGFRRDCKHIQQTKNKIN